MNYRGLSDSKARLIIKRFGEPIEIDGVSSVGIFDYPTEDQIIKRSGDSNSASLIRQKMRIPEIHLHKVSGLFVKGQEVKLVGRPAAPVFWLSDPEYNEDWIYRVELIETQPDPVDSKGRKWR